MRRVARHPRGLVVALAVAAALLAGCGDNGSSSSSTETTSPTSSPTSTSSAANEAVCTARTDLTAAVNVVVNDVKAGNFGLARQHVSDITSAADKLKSAVDSLGQTERDKLTPQVDKLSTDLQNLDQAGSLAELQSALLTVRTELGDLVDTLKTDLGCSD